MLIKKMSLKAVAAALCVGAMLTQVFAGPVYESQFDHIDLRQAPSGLVKPVTRHRLLTMEALSDFASRLTPTSELSDGDWLLPEDEESPVLEVYTLNDDTASPEDGEDWTSLLRVTKRTKKLKKIAKKATKYTWTLMTLTLTGEEEDADNEEEEEDEDEEEEDKVAVRAQYQHDQLASEDAQRFLEDLEAASEEATLVTTDRYGYIDDEDARKRMLEVRRKMMLNLELDSLVLASF